MLVYKKIGERLIESGLISEEQLKIALDEQKKTGELIGAILFSKGFISQQDLLKVLSMSHTGDIAEQKEEIDIPDDIEDIVRKSTTALRSEDRAAGTKIDVSLVPIVRLVENIIFSAVDMGATDIHIGPDTRGTRIRFRIDGRLRHAMYLPKSLLPAIVSRVKIMGSMNIAENRVPQDGGTMISRKNMKYDVRISTFPIVDGENVVMRLLNKSQLILGLENLGFEKEDIETLNHSLTMPYGMILMSGPTGSGKTTTLYSALSIINSVYKNIFTIEDPIEYHLPLIRQSQINVKAGLTFASGLRSILRQDPDVILIGEMRDFETAELAIRSSLTGHLVFSTLHTNDAASSLPRLIDMGVEPFLLASTVDTVISQRLIRLLCDHCKEPYSPPNNSIEGSEIRIPEGAVFYKAKGCEKCNDSGYRGRTVIYEIMKMNQEIKELVINKAGSDTIAAAAKKGGMRTMFDVGIHKVISGKTSLEEVLSTTRTVS
ncbi:MAG: Flp pilus assembly complex ATPase component TadA [Nitrospirae bacterium]|nr:Flp pilus assembly complex ATPase component TadA [Nitrospirota bacterium]